LLMKARRGTPYLSAWRHTVSDCGSTPPTAQKTPTAPSRTRSERSTSTVKSTWPGVSMMLTRVSPQKAGGGGGGDGDAALLLLDHPVHGGSPVVHLADLVRAAGVIKDALGRRGFTRVDVRHDPDVASLLQRYLTCHDLASCLAATTRSRRRRSTADCVTCARSTIRSRAARSNCSYSRFSVARSGTAEQPLFCVIRSRRSYGKLLEGAACCWRRGAPELLEVLRNYYQR
jgi:hypothetical protein